MRRILSVLAVIAVAFLAIIPLVAEPASAATNPTGVPTSPGACRRGGWQTLSDPTGAPFATKPACVQWAKAHPGGHLGLADLRGTFAGIESFTFECTFVHQIFDATYPTPAKSRAGSATLNIEGCVSNSITTFDGTFSITTSSGTVSGTVTGTLDAASAPAFFHFVLTPTATTGLFTGATGTLQVEIEWAGFPETAITGTVALPTPI